MQFHMLKTPEIDRPAIRLQVTNYGAICIRTDDGAYVHGEHIAVTGEPEDVESWLSEYDSVWVGEGPLPSQDFTIMHIRKRA